MSHIVINVLLLSYFLYSLVFAPKLQIDNETHKYKAEKGTPTEADVPFFNQFLIFFISIP